METECQWFALGGRGSESEVELECRGLVGGGEMFDEVSVDRENTE
jgi:hypothetical protein